MEKDEAIRYVFIQACCDFRKAKMEGRDDDADLFLNATNALEAAYRPAVDAVKR